MSTHVMKAVQLGFNSDASKNFVLETLNNGTMRLARGNKGATTQDILTIGIDGKVAIEEGISQSVLTSGTPVTLTNQTSVDFTGIPSWVKRITVQLAGVSTNSNSLVQIQLGDAGGVETTGYSGSVFGTGSTAISNTTYSSGFYLRNNEAASLEYCSNVIITKVSGNTWIESHTQGSPDGNAGGGGGQKTLSDTLTTVRLTTVGGTAQFDAGTVNIIYE